MSLVDQGYDLSRLHQAALKLRSAYAQRNARWEREEQLYYGEYEPDVPEKAKVVHLPTAYQIVRDFQALLLYKTPKFAHLGISETEKGKKASEKVTAFLNLFFSHPYLEQRRLYELMSWHLLMRGVCTVRVLFDPSHLPPKPEGPGPKPELPSVLLDEAETRRFVQEMQAWLERQEEYEGAMEKYRQALLEKPPIDITVIDPKWVYPDLSEPPTYLFLRWERPLLEVITRWPHLELEGVAIDQNVTWYEYWDDTYYAYWVEYVVPEDRGMEPMVKAGRRPSRIATKWVKEPTPHGLGVLPWVLEGVYGNPPHKPDKRYMGVLADIADILALEHEVAAQWATASRLMAWPSLIYQGSRFRDFSPKLDFLATTPIDETEQLQWFIPQIPLPAIQALQAYLQGYISKGVVGAGAFGRVTARSAAQQAMLSSQARLSVIPYERALARALSKVASLILRYIYERWDDSIWVAGVYEGDSTLVTINPKEIGGNYNVAVRLQTPYYEEMQARLPLVERLINLGLISRETAAEMLDLEEYHADTLRQLFEAVIRHPVFTERLLLEAFTRFWPEAVPELIQQLQKGREEAQAQQQAPPPEGTQMRIGPTGIPQPIQEELMQQIAQQAASAVTRRRRPRRIPRQLPNIGQGGVT